MPRAVEGVEHSCHLPLAAQLFSYSHHSAQNTLLLMLLCLLGYTDRMAGHD